MKADAPLPMTDDEIIEAAIVIKARRRKDKRRQQMRDYQRKYSKIPGHKEKINAKRRTPEFKARRAVYDANTRRAKKLMEDEGLTQVQALDKMDRINRIKELLTPVPCDLGDGEK